MIKINLSRLALMCLMMFLGSCSSSPEQQTNTPAGGDNKPPDDPAVIIVAKSRESGELAEFQSQNGGDTAKPETYQIYSARGNVIRQTSKSSVQEELSGEVTLNFQEADIGEVVKSVIGDILQRSYTIAPGLEGSVILRTTSPIPRSALIPTLETLLRANGAALIEREGLYEIIPLDEARAGGLSPKLQLSADRGYQMVVVPLRYIAVKEMVKILEPFKTERILIQQDEYRNLLILGGTHRELTSVFDTIEMFDVDQLKGMSVGLFRLENVEASKMAIELQSIFGDENSGPLSGMLRITPIERLNALLVITPQERYLGEIKLWLQRLDHSENASGLNMYVYYVQNGKAVDLADILGQLFAENRSNRSNKPRLEEERPTPVDVEGETQAKPATSLADSILDTGDITIIAHEENNALLILSSPSDYKEVEKALQKLDIVPLQVLVEASIVEVSLDDELQYGLQWFFTGGAGSKDSRGGLNIPNDGISDIVPNFVDPNFTYALFDAASTRVLLNALAEDSRLNVISSPSLMVLDNYTARIRVGDQVPIRTSETTNTSGTVTVPDSPVTGALVTSTIQYRDTGVLLEVTPRVNAGGLVILDISQEVNDVEQTFTSSIDSPTITQRLINTTVAVQSGETIVLGGLIKETKDESSSGVPFLRKIPIIRWLFSSEGRSTSRTELVVMITLNAVTNLEESRQVTDEYRQKLKDIGI
ncbi:type II secretion system secretin GspD [Aestuariicella hydrocarbonica]|uniref:Type II secretion system secretin GspD n=1 Tax=Pseudomaricurvus hydrocarbonicus TaxID=1470433 RepID=A0A9E5JS65_9GAMM|nr:type II secretion system secretin GspD [Aestuariicella hydrocarbonica]NHO65778.1 type II secretion system secretin GspD [Aestuariicella hydrocarbonica]